jgi:tetratricopeptide (TPR) repeat protein
VVAIHAIGGMPGVGKTSLAVHAAHLLKDRFPDRQLFLSLHAHTPGQDPVTSGAALAGLLAATGLDARYLPGDLEGRTALWRDRMAGQQALLVLDNAASSSQVIPLLPGSGRCLVLVTSRRHLGDLPGAAAPVLLEVLPAQEAREMFVRLAPRAADAPAVAIAELVQLAGFLPLAISLLARVYTRHPSWTPEDLTAETRAGLLTLTAENDSVCAAFGVSYRHLPPGRQEFFRRLGLHPGTTIDGYAAAALVGTSLREAAAQLDALHGEGLLTEVGHRRYGMHDLIRRYGQDLAAADPGSSREQALGRLLGYYQHTAALAGTLLARQARTSPALAPQAPPAALPSLADSTQALAWARAERANLLACLDHATATGQHARVVALTAATASLLRHDGPWASAITRHTTAVTAARHLGDRLGQANALTDLGDARRLTGDHRGAVEALEEALAMFRDLGDRLGQASSLNDLGIVRRMTGDYRGAAEALEEALGISRDLGNRLGQANALAFLGIVRRTTGDYRGAAEALEEALGVCRDIGDRGGEAEILNETGTLYRVRGDPGRAAEYHRQALDLSREITSLRDEACALAGLGRCALALGRTGDAAEGLRQARDLFQRIGAAEATDVAAELDRLAGPGPARQPNDHDNNLTEQH